MMEDCWLEQEEFNFDIHLSPLLGENEAEKAETSSNHNEDEDEVFFGPVGHMERCAAVVAEKDVVEPQKTLEPEQQALLLQESAALSVILKHKPLASLHNTSPVAVVYPMMKRDSVTLQQTLSLLTARTENKENVKPERNKKILEAKNVKDTTDGENTPRTQSATRNPRTSLNLGSAEKPKPRGIPKMVLPSKIARPSGIPSLKAGLLAGQPRLRGQSNQDSKMKPIKATHTLNKNNAIPSGSNATDSGVRTLSAGLRSTPVCKVNKSKSISEASQARRSIGFSPALSKQTPKSAAKGPTDTSSRRSSISKLAPRRSISRPISTPQRNAADGNVSSILTKDGGHRSTSTGIALPRPPKPLSNEDSPVSSRSTVKRRLSAVKSNNSPRSSMAIDIAAARKSSLRRRTSLLRSDTFVLTSPAADTETRQALMDVPNQHDDVCKPNNTRSHFVDDKTDDRTQTESCSQALPLLMPEIAMMRQSPLLKFDSPAVEEAPTDLFATRHTPPASVNDLLSPVQMQKDLIEF